MSYHRLSQLEIEIARADKHYKMCIARKWIFSAKQWLKTKDMLLAELEDAANSIWDNPISC